MNQSEIFNLASGIAVGTLQSINQPQNKNGCELQQFIMTQESGSRAVFTVLGIRMQSLSELKASDRVRVTFRIQLSASGTCNSLIVEGITKLK